MGITRVWRNKLPRFWPSTHGREWACHVGRAVAFIVKQFLLVSCPVIAKREGGGLGWMDHACVIVRLTKARYGHFLACYGDAAMSL
jgi:hypothetical protein